MSGSFVISLDLELMWGVRDHRNVASYGDAILGGRAAIPEMLRRFEAGGIRATWATVGLLFARTRDEMLDYAPDLRPVYENPAFSCYPMIEAGEIGSNEEEDPHHFGLSLIERIAETPGQEIATHTYSHYYCLEPGQNLPMFEADLTAANAIASARGIAMRSIVFPRNQKSAAHAQAAEKQGLGIYRGEALGWLYRPRSGAETTLGFRALRFADGVLPLSGAQVVQTRRDGAAYDVPASRFLRPWSRKLAAYDVLHLRRITGEMEAAAKLGDVYHLWWHPHNFGRNTARNLARLDVILQAFRRCRDRYGMTSHSMMDLGSATQ